MLYQTIDNASQFRDAFQQAGRGSQFSYDALGLLFEFLEDMGEDVELDVIALCCEFSEESEETIRDYYNIDADQDVEDYLQDNTMVVGRTDAGNYVFAQF